MNLTLNDFRSILGKVNDGNIAYKNDHSGIEKVNYGSSFFTRNIRDVSAEDNKQLRRDFMAAISKSISGQGIDPVTLNEIKTLLGIEGENVSEANLNRNTIVEVFKRIDKSDASGRGIQTAADLITKSHPLGTSPEASVRTLSILGHLSNEIGRLENLASPENMKAVLGVPFKGYNDAQMTKFLKNNFETIRTKLFENGFFDALKLGEGHETEFKFTKKHLQDTVTFIMRDFAAHREPKLKLMKVLPPLENPVKPEEINNVAGRMLAFTDRMVALAKPKTVQSIIIARFAEHIKAFLFNSIKENAQTVEGMSSSELNDLYPDDNVDTAKDKCLLNSIEKGLATKIRRMQTTIDTLERLAKNGKLFPLQELGFRLYQMVDTNKAVDSFSEKLEEFFTAFDVKSKVETAVRNLVAEQGKNNADEYVDLVLKNMSSVPEGETMSALDRLSHQAFLVFTTGKDIAGKDVEDINSHINGLVSQQLNEHFLAAEDEISSRVAQKEMSKEDLNASIDELAKDFFGNKSSTLSPEVMRSTLLRNIAGLIMPSSDVESLDDNTIADKVCHLPPEDFKNIQDYVANGLLAQDLEISKASNGIYSHILFDTISNGKISAKEFGRDAGTFLSTLMQSTLAMQTQKAGTNSQYDSQATFLNAIKDNSQLISDISEDLRAILEHYPSEKDGYYSKSKEELKDYHERVDNILSFDLNDDLRKSMFQSTCLEPLIRQLTDSANAFPGFAFNVKDLNEFPKFLNTIGIQLKDLGNKDTMIRLLMFASISHISGHTSDLSGYCRQQFNKEVSDITIKDYLAWRLKSPQPDQLEKVTASSFFGNVNRDAYLALSGQIPLAESKIKPEEINGLYDAMKLLSTKKSGESVEVTACGIKFKVSVEPNGVAMAEFADKKNVRFRLSSGPQAFVKKLENMFIAQLKDNGGDVKFVKKLLPSMADIAQGYSIGRARELFIKVLSAKQGIAPIMLTSVPTKDLRELALQALNGSEIKPETLNEFAGKTLESAEMLELRDQVENLRRTQPKSLAQQVKMPTSLKVRTIEQREANTPPKNVREFIADLFMNFDTREIDRELLGNGVKNGARLQALCKAFNLELAHIADKPDEHINGALPQFLLDKTGGEIKAIIQELAQAAKENADVAKFAELQQRIDALASTTMQELQKIVSEMFAQKPKASDSDPGWMKTLRELNGSNGLDENTAKGAFAKKVLDNYFKNSIGLDQRRMLSVLMRNVDKDSNNTAIVAELLKSSGPVLQKMLQGLPADSFEAEMCKALEDTKSRLPSIPEEAIRAQLLELVRSSNGNITSIEVQKTLGAASVGQALLCRIYTPDFPKTGVECVVKLLRPTGANAMQREKALIDKMPLTEAERKLFAMQYEGFTKELDLTVEAANVERGFAVYDQVDLPFSNTNKDKENNLGPIKANDVHSMELVDKFGSTVNAMVVQKAPGLTVDSFLRKARASMDKILDEGENPIRHEVALDKEGNEKKTVLSVTEINRYNEIGKVLYSKIENVEKRRNQLVHTAEVWIEKALFVQNNFFLHADMHSGNVMTSDTGATIIDFGAAIQLSDEERTTILRTIVNATTSNVDYFLQHLGVDPKSAAAYKAELQMVLSKGTANDCIARIRAGISILQNNGVAIPAALQIFMNSLDRLDGMFGTFDAEVRTLQAEFKNLTCDGLNKLIQIKVPDFKPATEKIGYFQKLSNLLKRFNSGERSSGMYEAMGDFMRIYPSNEYFATAERREQIMAYMNEMLECVGKDPDANRIYKDLADTFKQIPQDAEANNENIETFQKHVKNFIHATINPLRDISKLYFEDKDKLPFANIFSSLIEAHAPVDLKLFILKSYGFNANDLALSLIDKLDKAREHDRLVNSWLNFTIRKNNQLPIESRLDVKLFNQLADCVKDISAPTNRPWHGLVVKGALNGEKSKQLLEFLAGASRRFESAVGNRKLHTSELDFALNTYSASDEALYEPDVKSLKKIINTLPENLYNTLLVEAEKMKGDSENVKAALASLRAPEPPEANG